jgi:phosphopantothenoylcysteine decarboxylase / phosphopantothenate---cysteine ligase
VLSGKSILIVMTGGIAGYKILELVRRAREQGAALQIVMTQAAKQFVTPLSVASLAEAKVFDDLFSLTDENDMGHIQLSRAADLVVVAPATADIIAKMAHGLADDLASTVLLATDKRILVAPAMNVRMWLHPSTQRNVAQLKADGVLFIGPEPGEMACGEFGPGRMSEPAAILAAITQALQGETAILLPADPRSMLPGALVGRRIVVTSGPTHEPIDPVRYIANRSSGKQGHAIAAAAASAGAEVVLVSGPVALPDPAGVRTRHVETARQMFETVEASLPADAFVAAAAVSDWRAAAPAKQKIKKTTTAAPSLDLAENPDILASVAQRKSGRPALVIGFAAETEKAIDHARAKLDRKGCDLVVANDVSAANGVMGGDENEVTIVGREGIEAWPRMTKDDVARRLIGLIAEKLNRASR